MSRPQLTTYSKAILLMHRNDYVCCRPKEDTISALEFYKYLLISRDSLRASQLYQVYQFAICTYCSDDKKFYVSTTKTKYEWTRATHFKLTLEEIRTWNRLLKVQYMYLAKYKHEYAEEFMAVSRIFTGHIALSLFCDQDNAENHSDIIRQIQKQLYLLHGHAKSLIGSSDMPQLNLTRSYVEIENLYQFKQVMAKHRFKEILIETKCEYSLPLDEFFDDNFFDDFSTCPSVENLHFVLTNLAVYHDLVSKLTQMRPFFPNLVELLFKTEYYTDEDFSLQQMVVWIQGECKDIDKLQKASLSIPCTQLLYEFKIRTPESKKVVKQLVKEILETTKFNQEHSANIITKPKDYNNYVLIKQHYDVELWRKQSNCHAILQFTIDIKPVISEDESTEDNDN